MRWLWRGRSGQMVVELAVLLPVAIVVALIVYNLLVFVDLCALFDQVSLDAVVSHGVAPAGEQTELAAVGEVRSCIEGALDGHGSCEVEVEASDAGGGLTRYACRLSYHPWPLRLRMPGVTYASPVVLRHERGLVVDRFRPGVVV